MGTSSTAVNILFEVTTLLTVLFFYRAANNSKPTLIVLLSWLALQTFIGLSGFYTVTDTLPPRFLLLVLPPLLVIIYLFASNGGRQYLDRLDLKILTMLHIVRIPVEFVLLWLFLAGTVPELMTYEGRNFDILSGMTAPVIFYYAFVQKKLNHKLILAWNFICLALLLNIVINAVLSAPSPFQKFAFDQPNVAVLYFPFVWLPCCIVPLVLLSHLASIRKLLQQNTGVQSELSNSQQLTNQL